MPTDKITQVEFAPGCFDDWDGTQQELDDLITEIKRMANTGELLDSATEIDLEDLKDVQKQSRPESSNRTRH